MDFPDSPEAVAFHLLKMILEREGDAPAERRNQRRGAAELLDLYAECLKAIHGDRPNPATAMRH